MSAVEIITLFITILCLVSFCAVFTILFNHYYKSNIDSVSSGKEDIELIDNAIDEEKEKQSKSKKAWRLVGKIFSYVLLGVVFAFFVFSLASKIQNNTMLFGDSTLVVIASGSMSEKNNDIIKKHPELNNQFDTYDIIGITKYQKQEEVSLFDVVAYKNKKNITIVHRIVEIHTDEKTGEVSYLTQGDTNLYADNTSNSQYAGYLTYDKIIGKYDGRRIKGLGIFVIFLQSPAGIVTVLSVVYCLFMFDHFSSKYKKAIAERTNMLVKLIDYDLSKEEVDDVVSNYHETLLYKNQLYTFQDGKYVGKEDSDTEIKKLKNHMVLVKRENGTITITVTNTKDNTSQIYENVSEEDASDPSKFIKEEVDDDEDEDDEEEDKGE